MNQTAKNLEAFKAQVKADMQADKKKGVSNDLSSVQTKT